MIEVKKDLTGVVFGRLTVLEQTEDYISPQGKHYSRWKCKCSCGNITEVNTCDLNKGHTISCGCEKNKKGIPNIKNKKYNTYELNLKDEHGVYGVGYCSNADIKFYFDMDDFELIKDYCWLIHKDGGNYYSLDAKIPLTGKCTKMHILIGFKGFDHIDRNPLNNRKYNLRQATKQENAMNASLSSNNTSGIIGVSFSKPHKKWKSYITFNRKQIYLGLYINKEDAIKARLKAEKEYFKEFAPQQHLYKQYNIQ